LRLVQPVAQPAETTGRGSHLNRGLRALEVLAEHPATAAQVATALGVNRSTGLRLLQELEALGFVARDLGTKSYRVVSERFLPMVSGLHYDWQELINPVLERCRREVGESTIFAIPVNGVMVHVSFYVSSHIIAVREQIGTVRPIHASAIGKAWLSALPEDQLEQEIANLDFAKGSPKAIKTEDELRRHVTIARERGYATDIEETLIGASCVAAPSWVGDLPVGAVAISAPSSRMDAERIERYGHLLMDGMRAIRQATAVVGQ
jgi:DNA-binding IclR family transcriptional regulator